MGPHRTKLPALCGVAVCAAAALAVAVPATAEARRIYVGLSGTTPDKVSVIESDGMTAVGSVSAPVGTSDPFSIAILPDGSRAYVSMLGGGPPRSVVTFDTTNLAPTAIALEVWVGAPTGVAITPDGSRVYAASGGGGIGTFTVIDTATDAPVATELFGATGNLDIAITPDGSRAYVSSLITNSVWVIDTATNSVVGAPIPLGATADPQAVAITPDGSRVYVANYGDANVVAIDTSSNAIDGLPISVGAGANPRDVAISPDGSRVYVANEGVGNIAVIDTATRSVTNIPLGGSFPDPSRVAVSPDGSRVYALDNDPFAGMDRLYVIDASTNQQLGSPLELGTNADPRNIAVTPDQGPVASFTHNPGAPDTPTTFDAAASYDPDGTVARYDWDFGDGTALPDGGPTPTHTYASSGTYTATLTVTDNEGASTEKVFTGQTMLRNGSPAARTSATVYIAGADAPDTTDPADTNEPTVKVTKPRIDKRYRWRRLRRISGTATDDSGIREVQYALANLAPKQRGKRARQGNRQRCRYIRAGGRLARKRTRCSKRRFLTAKGTTSWSVRLKRRLPKGHYRLYARAIDTSGNASNTVLVPFSLT